MSIDIPLIEKKTILNSMFFDGDILTYTIFLLVFVTVSMIISFISVKIGNYFWSNKDKIDIYLNNIILSQIIIIAISGVCLLIMGYFIISIAPHLAALNFFATIFTYILTKRHLKRKNIIAQSGTLGTQQALKILIILLILFPPFIMYNGYGIILGTWR